MTYSSAAVARAKETVAAHEDAAGALLHSTTQSVSNETSGALRAEFENGERANRNVSGLAEKPAANQNPVSF